jgi:hypothetical protein
LNFEDQLDQQGGWSLPSSELVSGHQVNLSYFDLNVVFYTMDQPTAITTIIWVYRLTISFNRLVVYRE